jgi:hypothetical protein
MGVLLYNSGNKVVKVGDDLYVSYQREGEVIVEKVTSLHPLEAEIVYRSQGSFPTISQLGGRIVLLYRKGGTCQEFCV